MKVTLEFDAFEEKEEFELALNGHKWNLVVWDIDQWLRNILKHGDITEEQDKIYEAVRSQLWIYLNDRDLSL